MRWIPNGVSIITLTQNVLSYTEPFVPAFGDASLTCHHAILPLSLTGKR
jgi:hypothetical protein